MDTKSIDSFRKVWPAHVGSFTRFLITCRRAFHGDIDMFLILALVGDRTFSQRHADPELEYGGLRLRAAESTPPLVINLCSISEFSGIPRETVRRKINQLVDLGWVSKQRNGSFQATSKAKKDLKPLTLAGIQYTSGAMQLFTETVEPEALAKESGRPRKKAVRTSPIPR